jgi:hypothetical protein
MKNKIYHYYLKWLQITDKMKNVFEFIFWDIHQAVRWKLTDVSEEHDASIFSVEEKPRKKPA